MNTELIEIEREPKERSSNFELLRMILMLMIIALHYFNGGMGGLFGAVKPEAFNYYLSHFLESLCIIAVNVFVIITGYFSCKKTRIKISKVINLYGISIFYGIVISTLISIITKTEFNWITIKSILTTAYNRWFVVIYCILYLLIPYINKLIKSITRKQFETLLIINIIFFYLWPTFLETTTIKDGGYGIINFVNLYMVGAYIKMYRDNKVSIKLSIIVYLICTIITTRQSFSGWAAWNYNTITNLIGSIAIFELFKSIKIKNSKAINKLATYTFSTYIIHENAFFVKILYRTIFGSNKYWNSEDMFFNLIITTIGIYVICVVIEFIRRLIFRKIFDDKIDKIEYEISCE